ncbi:hypothetical protein TPA0598_03_00720 [Streptomyces lydicamycinicus]|uniref:Uncharacterized protein n=1 Tax=Streptomyces lydicamycinicus TaxID=1546107 RepID=A0A0N7YL23_9ACTN|nr:hypothetical protein TPA0598_03_00720 [Streptomyces lydicamycinicus]
MVAPSLLSGTAVGLPAGLERAGAAAGISPPDLPCDPYPRTELLRFTPVHRVIHRDPDRDRRINP